MDRHRHRLNVADIVTLLRIAGSFFLLALQPFSTAFFCLYALTGLTDVLDGWIARKTKTANDFGARLDSIADVIFCGVVLGRILPELLTKLPDEIWYAAGAVAFLRVSAYITAAIKYRLFASLHTYLNKLTGIAVFFLPFLAVTEATVGYCWLVCAIAAASALEELGIQLQKRAYDPNTKSIFLILKTDENIHFNR